MNRFTAAICALLLVAAPAALADTIEFNLHNTPNKPVKATVWDENASHSEIFSEKSMQINESLPVKVTTNSDGEGHAKVYAHTTEADKDNWKCHRIDARYIKAHSSVSISAYNDC